MKWLRLAHSHWFSGRRRGAEVLGERAGDERSYEEREEERKGGEEGGGLIERMRGVGVERGDGRRVGRRGEVWAEILTQMMSFSLYHGNLRNAFSKPRV